MIAQKKNNKNILIGIVHIKSTFNNTLITITDLLGNTLVCTTCGTSGFKGSRKKTPFAAQTATKNAILKALELGLEKVEIIIKGRGNGRESSIRAIKNTGIKILSIEDQTSIAHNGCRPPKKRSL